MSKIHSSYVYFLVMRNNEVEMVLVTSRMQNVGHQDVTANIATFY